MLQYAEISQNLKKVSPLAMKKLNYSRFSRIRIGFIGCGKMADFHAQVLRHLGVKIWSVCGATPDGHAKAFAKRYNIPKIYPNAKALLNGEKVDAFWVVASWHALEGLLMPAIKTNIPCFFEKPVALRSNHLQKIVQKNGRQLRKVLIGYNRRFYDFIPKIKSI